MEKLEKFVEWTASIGIMVATVAISSNVGLEIFSFTLFFISNILWAIVGMKKGMGGLVSMALFLSAVNLWGIYRWWN